MGRGNVKTRGCYEGLFYVDYNHFETYMIDEETGNATDEHDTDAEEMFLRDSIDEFAGSFCKKVTAFTRTYPFGKKSDGVLLESKLFTINIVDNEWSYAVMLLQKEGTNSGLQKKLFQRYLDIIQETLFEQFKTLGIYGGPWTSGTITRPPQKKYYISDCRIPASEKQEGLFYYAIRHTDTGSFPYRGYTLERWVLVNHFADVVTNFEVKELIYTEKVPKPFMPVLKFMNSYDVIEVENINDLKESV